MKQNDLNQKLSETKLFNKKMIKKKNQWNKWFKQKNETKFKINKKIIKFKPKQMKQNWNKIKK